MVQVPGAHQLRSPLQEKPGLKSEADSSMWTIVIFGILTAIFAWVWYGGRGDGKEADTQVQQQGQGNGQLVGDDQDGARSDPDTLINDQRPVTACISTGERKPHASASNEAEESSKVRSETAPVREGGKVSEDEAQSAGVFPGECVQAKEQRGLSAPLPEEHKVDPRNVPQQEEAQTTAEDSFTHVPYRKEVQASVSPRDVPHMSPCAAESNGEYTPADNVTDTLSTEENDVSQSNADEMLPKGVQETNGLRVMEDGNACDEGTMSPESVPGQEADNPTQVWKRESVWDGEESCKDGVFEPKPMNQVQQLQMNHISAQNIGVLHINGEEESQPKAQEANVTGQIKEFSLALPDGENSGTILEAAKEIKDCQECENQVLVNERNTLNENHGGVPDKFNFVKQECFSQFKTGLTDGLSPTNHNGFAEITIGMEIPVPSKSVSSKTTSEAFTSTHILEDHSLKVGQANPILDLCNKISLSNQDVESSNLEWSMLGEVSCSSNQSEAMVHEVDYPKAKRVAAVQPMPQNVNFGFKVHYITYSESQMIAVTGDHEKLGKWEAYVPLTYVKDGFWSHLVTLPVDTSIEWKFVMVENGKIKRWEECTNRCLKIAHDDIGSQQWWGYP